MPESLPLPPEQDLITAGDVPSSPAAEALPVPPEEGAAVDQSAETTEQSEAPQEGASTRKERITIPRDQWTPAMQRKAAEASGKLVVDPISGVPINKPDIVHPGQLGKGTEG